MRVAYYKRRIIKFTNTKQIRVGKGIKALRQRANLLPKQLADKVGINESYLYCLEEGYEPEVDRTTLEDIAQVVGVCKRGALTDEQLINLFLYANKCEPPRLFNMVVGL